MRRIGCGRCPVCRAASRSTRGLAAKLSSNQVKRDFLAWRPRVGRVTTPRPHHPSPLGNSPLSAIPALPEGPATTSGLGRQLSVRYSQSDRNVAHPLPPTAYPSAIAPRGTRRGPRPGDASVIGHLCALVIPQLAAKQSGARNPVGIWIGRGFALPSGKCAPHLRAVFALGLPRSWSRIGAGRTTELARASVMQ
jgi:hypothetical protein